eukprot:7391808-Prymnesium_polylepis.3
MLSEIGGEGGGSGAGARTPAMPGNEPFLNVQDENAPSRAAAIVDGSIATVGQAEATNGAIRALVERRARVIEFVRQPHDDLATERLELQRLRFLAGEHGERAIVRIVGKGHNGKLASSINHRHDEESLFGVPDSHARATVVAASTPEALNGRVLIGLVLAGGGDEDPLSRAFDLDTERQKDLENVRDRFRDFSLVLEFQQFAVLRVIVQSAQQKRLATNDAGSARRPEIHGHHLTRRRDFARIAVRSGAVGVGLGDIRCATVEIAQYFILAVREGLVNLEARHIASPLDTTTND